MRVIDTPTGKIIIDNYSKGELETLSIGDYGKSKNIKADFLGFTSKINGVPNGKCLPLSEKWVVTLSTQYGCNMKCKFCDAHNVNYSGNATIFDLKEQFLNARNQFSEVTYTDRLNIHFARMGEPVFNYRNIFKFCDWLLDKHSFQRESNLRVETIHPVFTTSLPKLKITKRVIEDWCYIKNYLFQGQAGLQLSINDTRDHIRNDMFNNLSFNLKEIAEFCKNLDTPIGRKYCLNFAVTDTTEIDPTILSYLFDKEKWMIKITPVHNNNNSCEKYNYKITDGYSSYYPYSKYEESLKKYGFDVLVFVPSLDEDKGCITCGNAILGGSKINL